ncbi:MAG: flagellar basal body rod protein FlgB [Syntrophomonadaceae bacterium]|jgi:flagellar basal-body rod protein FlgB|nr:flagellar basal body rod protein FlgB [Syntrophomonadaceae bacterium]MDH7497018.1 flagellar basal body rod protein FlgB [Syntrophomonadaceae bacterium]
MLDRLIGNPTVDLMERALDGASLRQKVIAHNLANVETPGFKALQVSFEEQLRRARGTVGGQLRTSHARHLQIGGTASAPPVITEQAGASMRNDGNSVDIDREMALLAKNQVYYDAMVSGVNQEFRLLRLAITGGRG